MVVEVMSRLLTLKVTTRGFCVWQTGLLLSASLLASCRRGHGGN